MFDVLEAQRKETGNAEDQHCGGVKQTSALKPRNGCRYSGADADT